MASAEVQALVANPALFEQLVAQLLSPDNNARGHAETIFDQLKEHSGDACMTFLAQTMRNSANVEHRSFSAIMLRKVRCRTRFHDVRLDALNRLLNALSVLDGAADHHQGRPSCAGALQPPGQGEMSAAARATPVSA